MKVMKLKKSREFSKVYRNGAYCADKLLTVYALKSGNNYSAFGISAGKKVGGSVVRSRVTRLLREAIRLNLTNVKPGYDIVVLARAGSGGESFNIKSRIICGCKTSPSLQPCSLNNAIIAHYATSGDLFA